jgi:hypothetical protein
MWYSPGVDPAEELSQVERKRTAEASSAEANAWLKNPTIAGRHGPTLAERLAAELQWPGTDESTEDDQCHQTKP